MKISSISKAAVPHPEAAWKERGGQKGDRERK